MTREVTTVNRTEDQINDYYEDLTVFINEKSGLEAVSPKQVQMVWRLSKVFEASQRSNKSGDLTIGGKYADRRENPRCCTAKRTDGEPCRRYAVKGSTVCRVHGGAAKQTVNKARIRLQNASFQMAQQLLNMATDENVSDAVKLKAITEALDRGGLAVKSTVDVDISIKPYESIFEQMEGGSRAAHRGEEPQTPALVAAGHDAIDVQIVEDDLDGDNPADLGRTIHPITPDGYESSSVFDSAPSPMHREPPAEGLMSMDEAVAAMAEMRRQSAAGSTRIHRAQRALPPGKSARG
jgi:hypothetical protein